MARTERRQQDGQIPENQGDKDKHPNLITMQRMPIRICQISLQRKETIVLIKASLRLTEKYFPIIISKARIHT